MLKSNKGITLVALVITIIVLLILAGVTLMLALGDNGILGQAKKARITQIEAEVKETMELALLSARSQMLADASKTPPKTTFTATEVEDYIKAALPKKADGTTLEDGWAVSGGKITYTGANYLAATDYTGAKIEYQYTYTSYTLNNGPYTATSAAPTP